jgi:SAM-dependent methyltransferase
MLNEYTKQWFDVFLETMPESLTAFEVDAITERLPLPNFQDVLDICCGPARHAQLLAEQGYRVTGIDRDTGAVRRAAEVVPSGTFVDLDQRHLRTLERHFDGAVILWQSFGFFDTKTNDQILADIASILRPAGRLLLDLFHREYFDENQGRSTDTRDPRCEAISNKMVGNRLTSTIEYLDGTSEQMEFELFTPEEISARASTCGLLAVEACCWWDRDRPPTPAEQRFQIVFERS